ncbi:MAG: GTPase HflX, partial [Elusimicrobia bacterium]|nr:GTPase HflX [Elusimicrobiota bacterium]
MERTAIVGFEFKGKRNGGALSSLEELKRLVETAGGEVQTAVIQRRPEKNPATLVGSGKVEELAGLAEKEQLDAVVFDEDLTPTQQRNLQERIPSKVIDRTRLILDIFAKRARSKEGQLQVELAQLNYLLPRTTARFGRFEQQMGGARGGIGTRGPGERKLEVDQRHIRDRISHIKTQIERMRNHRALQREHRREVPLPVVALVGYTNVGKSTLLNALDKDGSHPWRRAPGTEMGPEAHGRVYADDKLFATLDPTTRRVKLPGGRQALFTDTVGFIQKLPHHLVAAFHATLEEIADADLLVHVVDAAHPHWTDQYQVVQEVIKTLDADRVPQETLFNKGDLLNESRRAFLQREGRLIVSASSGEGLTEFLTRV